MFDISKYNKKIVTKEEDFQQYKVQLEREYSRIDTHFGPPNAMSPARIDQMLEKHHYFKIDRQYKHRKDVFRTSMMQLDTEERPRTSSSTVNQHIKGRSYFLQLGEIPMTSKTTFRTQHRSSIFYRSFQSTTPQAAGNKYNQPKTVRDVMLECTKLIGQKPQSCKNADTQNNHNIHYRPYKVTESCRKTFDQQKHRKDHLNNLKLLDSISEQIGVIRNVLKEQQQKIE